MILEKTFISNLENQKNIYDLIGVCYDELFRINHDMNVGFVCKYNLNDNSNARGFYADKCFRELDKELLKLVEYKKIDNTYSVIPINELIKGIVKILNSFVMPNCKSKVKIAKSICLFRVIFSLDKYVHDINEDNIDRVKGPKNNKDSNYLVYIKKCSSFLDKGLEKITDKSIDYFFENSIQIIKRNELPVPERPPQIIRVNPEFSPEKKVLKVCCIPYIGFPTFKFIDCRNNTINRVSGTKLEGVFTVEYPIVDSKDDIQGQNRIIKLLDSAISKEADIIVFPEYIMSNSMYEAIKKHLKSRNCKLLKLVFMGTTYTMGKDGSNNNILKVLNGNGKELGAYYKYSPYSKEVVEKKSKSIFIEDLTNPGKECVILDIDRLGRILPSICRDIINNKCTYNLAHIFEPDLIIIPAWSPSLRFFKSKMIGFADTLHSSSILCNSCEARGKEDKTGKEIEEIGLAVVPSQKKGVQAKFEYIKRDGKGCTEKCREGCVRMITLDFSDDYPRIQIVNKN